MKKLYLLLLSAFFVSVIFGQHENTFVKEGKMWNVEFKFYDHPIEYLSLELAYAMTGDMEVEGKTYKKLYAISDTTLQRPLAGNYCLVGGFREEDQKVWFLPININSGEKTIFKEFLMYDFSVKLGDEITVVRHDVTPYVPFMDNFFSGPGKRTINIKDVWVDEQGRKCVDIGYDVWIEGIGGTRGLFWSNIVGISDGYQRDSELKCVKENETVIYNNKELCPLCFCSVLQLKTALKAVQSNKTDVVLSPNPVRNDLNITVSEDMLPCVMNVFTPAGEYVTGKKLTKAQDQLSMMGMNAGLYLYRVTTDSGALLDSGKVIKE